MTETHDKRTETHACDLISRRQAIYVCLELIHERRKWMSDAGQKEINGIDAVMCAIQDLPSAQPVEDIRAMCGECDAWNQYKNYPQPEQFNPCTVCQEFDCTGCKFRRT